MIDQVSVEFENFYQPYKKWFGVRAYPTREGGLSVFFRDITDRKLAENAARREPSDSNSLPASPRGCIRQLTYPRCLE